MASRASAAIVVGAGIVVFAIVAAAHDFPLSWLTVFAAVAGAITLLMVFVIQHTQSREQAATQLKLDEVIRALPRADDRLVHVEAGADEELVELEKRQVAHHVAMRDSADAE